MYGRYKALSITPVLLVDASADRLVHDNGRTGADRVINIFQI